MTIIEFLFLETKENYKINPLPLVLIITRGKRRELVKKFLKLEITREEMEKFIPQVPIIDDSPSSYQDHFCDADFVPFIEFITKEIKVRFCYYKNSVAYKLFLKLCEKLFRETISIRSTRKRDTDDRVFLQLHQTLHSTSPRVAFNKQKTIYS